MIQTLLTVLACTFAAGPAGGMPHFEPHVIDSVGRNLGQTALVDMNRNGKLDYVVGEESRNFARDIWWFEFVAWFLRHNGLEQR